MTTTPTSLDTLWYTRCPVPTASGIAHRLGWLADDFARDDLALQVLQDAPPEIAEHHFDHLLVGLFREGGNVPALVARAEGAPTRLIGLTWIDEGQRVVVRPDSGIASAADLAGRRLAVPGWAGTRTRSFPRAMALHGLTSALRTAGLTLADAELVEVPGRADRRPGWDPSAAAHWPGLDELAAGTVDAVYLKGGRSAEQAAAAGFVVAVDLDATPSLADRVNNGTPRPITVHAALLDERPELVVRFLAQTLRAARWATEHPDEVRAFLGSEVGSGGDGVATAYGTDVHLGLTPDLSPERLALLDQQQRFLHEHAFTDAPVDVHAWADPAPLAAARRLLDEEEGR
ncbi:ABC transporter substrate-binding protein [Pimelobacter simplex]|uniref:ABC transporter substrate-binding protein n=1 Tax=Nocardioides simplex TaxID=2045 RepID=UPI00382D067D